jgi:hypothetical protein
VKTEQKNQGRQNRLPWIALALIAAVALAIIVSYFAAERVEQQQQGLQGARVGSRTPPERGTACSALADARRAFDSGDTDELKASIREARQLAVIALNTTGISFGKPEEMALFLGSEELNSSAAEERFTRRLDVARDACGKTQT